MTTLDRSSVLELAARHVYHCSALRGAAQLQPEWSWELIAAALGIDLDWVRNVAWWNAIEEDELRSGQLSLLRDLEMDFSGADVAPLEDVSIAGVS